MTSLICILFATAFFWRSDQASVQERLKYALPFQRTRLRRVA